MLKYYFPAAQNHEMDPDPREFSKFSELQNSSVAQALMVHKYNKNDFAEWVVNGNIDTAMNVRKLPAILANKRAKEVFLKSNITEAVKHLSADEKNNKGLKDASFRDLVTELISRCRNIEWNYIKTLRNDPRFEDEKNEIEELEGELSELIEDIKER